MALFKILRGSSTALSSVPLTDGYAYFTPDDGRFYIDVALSAPPAHRVLMPNDEVLGVYRIELRPSEVDLAGIASSAINNLSFDYATSTLTITKGSGATSTISIPPLIQLVS